MYKRLLVPVDSTELSARAMRQGVDLAQQLGATLVGFVVEAAPPLPTSAANLASYSRHVKAHESRTQAHASELLERFKQAATAVGVPFEGQYERNDDIAGAIAGAAERLDVDMIVMVTHGRGGFGRLLFGSQTSGVQALSRKPLLVLR